MGKYEELLAELGRQLDADLNKQPEEPEEPEVPVDPEPELPDAAEVARLQGLVDAARKRLRDTLNAIAKLKGEGAEVPGYLWRNRDKFQSELDFAKADYVEYAGTQPSGSDPVMPPVTEPEPEPLPGIPVANRVELDAALSVAEAGDVFRLAGGDYGNLEIRRVLNVTISGGSFGSIKVSGPNQQTRGGGVKLDGVKAKYVEFVRCDGVSIRKSDVEQLFLESCDGVGIVNNWIHDGHFPLRVLRTKRFKIIGNVIERAKEDALRIYGDSQFGEIRGNAILDNRAAKPLHGDHIQIYGLPGEATGPRDMVIEQNLLHDNAGGKSVVVASTGEPGVAAGAQGIFVGDGKGDFNNFSIRHNLMRVSMVNAIYMKSAPENYLVSENIVLPVKGQNMARIRLPEFANQPGWNLNGVVVERNVATKIEKETPEGVVRSDNYQFGASVNGLFAGITDDQGETGNAPEHYRLADGSPVPAGLVSGWLEDTIDLIRSNMDAAPRV